MRSLCPATLATSGNVVSRRAGRSSPARCRWPAQWAPLTGNADRVCGSVPAWRPPAPVAVGGTVAATSNLAYLATFNRCADFDRRVSIAGVIAWRDRESAYVAPFTLAADLGIVGSLGIAGDVPHTSQLVAPGQTGSLRCPSPAHEALPAMSGSTGS